MEVEIEMKMLPQVNCCNAVKMAFKNYGNFNGRSRRSEFWYFHLFICVVLFGFYIILFILANIFDEQKKAKDAAMLVGFGAAIVFLLVILIQLITLSVRRLHDAGISGYVYLVIFLPFIGILILIYLFCIDSKANNNYGPSPKYYLPQYNPLDPNGNAYGVPVNPFPQPNPMPPQAFPYPQPSQMPSQAFPYPQPNQKPSQVTPYPQQNQLPPQISPYPQVSPDQLMPPPPPPQGP